MVTFAPITRSSRVCEVLKISRSSYYKWKASAPAREQRACDDALLAARIAIVFGDHDGCYGTKRITAELNDHGDDHGDDHGAAQTSSAPASPVVNHKRVARLMRTSGLAGFTRRRRVKTTVADPSRRISTDLVNRRFTAEAANQLYVGDITYLPISDGSNMYLATVIDCFSRRLVGFAIADHMRTSLVVDALTSAVGQRGSPAGAVFHSDHGSVYTSGTFQENCRQLGVPQSMGAGGTSADNALAESFNATLKREVLEDEKTFVNQLVCRRDVFRWCVRYNMTRRHSWCGYLPPQTYEARSSGKIRLVS